MENPKATEIQKRIDEAKHRVTEELALAEKAKNASPPDYPEAAGRVALSKQAQAEVVELEQALATENKRFADFMGEHLSDIAEAAELVPTPKVEEVVIPVPAPADAVKIDADGVVLPRETIPVPVSVPAAVATPTEPPPAPVLPPVDVPPPAPPAPVSTPAPAAEVVPPVAPPAPAPTQPSTT